MGSSIISAIHHIRASREYIDDFIRSAPNTRGAIIFKGYRDKLDWVLRDVITYPHFGVGVREAIKVEILSDPLQYPAIVDRIALLTPDQRERLEEIVETLIKKR
jgi:hypothetical protein